VSRQGGSEEAPPFTLRRHRRRLPGLRIGSRRDRGLSDPVVLITLPAQVGPAAADPTDNQPAAERARRPPLYWRLLRLRHVHPSGWQRALLVEGVFIVALLLVLAGKASAWTLLVLPVVVAALVKVHDVIAGSMSGSASRGTTSHRSG
jgi:hypothetical protein